VKRMGACGGRWFLYGMPDAWRNITMNGWKKQRRVALGTTIGTLESTLNGRPTLCARLKEMMEK